MQAHKKEKVTLSHHWKFIKKDYKIKRLAGIGSFGHVISATHRLSNQTVAIKLITNLYDSPYAFKKVIREIQILKQLTELKNNIFTTKLYDIILPNEDSEHLFLVMDYSKTDLRKLMVEKKPVSFAETHV